MQPQSIEIDELGKAFITVSSFEYTPLQMQTLYRFLSQYALDFHGDDIRKVFKDKVQVIDALKVLNSFATHYQNEEEIYEEFQDEVEDLLISMNQNEEGLIL
jgi:hypothetical protein